MKRTSFLAVFLIAFTVKLFSQYEGGKGQGGSKGDLFSVYLVDGIPFSHDVIYQGGNGEGFFINQETLFLGDFNANLYAGGIGGGFDKSNVFYQLGGTRLTDLYKGGTNDGHTHNQQYISVSEGPVLIYAGAGNDGYTEEQKFLSLADLDIPVMFSGGSADGYTDMKIFSGLEQDASLYRGGESDGEVQNMLRSVLYNQIAEQIYGGGVKDGFSDFSATYQLNSPVAIVEQEPDSDLFYAYPNPNEGKIINIYYKRQALHSSYRINVYTSTGQAVFKNLPVENNQIIFPQTLNQGVYILQISDNKSLKPVIFSVQ